ncbi:MAG: 3-dehydroquinate synthase [Candidatus Woesearchaeota archaeon]|nr:3-dehydroquinate synthase [Candidatus Woesearchaeota archaeon]
MQVNCLDYQIHIGTKVDIDLSSYGTKFLVLMDTNTERLFGDYFPDYPRIVVEAGEASKSMETYDHVLTEALKHGLDRQSCIVALGGGVVGDLAGFVAGTYMRGIKFIQVPTTLLAQVDSSVGGKTGINLGNTKNIVGVFHQPAAVYCDTSFLAHLPEKEIRSGLGEVIKYGCIKDPELFSYLEEHIEQIVALNPEHMQHIVQRSCEIKAAVVQQDEKESDYRRILNFGHTIGHAVEVHSTLTHGESIALGMVLEAQLSHTLGVCDEETVDRITKLLQAYGFTTQLPDIPKEQLLEKIKTDKKTIAGKTHYVLLEAIGNVRIQPVTEAQLNEVLCNLP